MHERFNTLNVGMNVMKLNNNILLLNPFPPNVTFLDPLKTSENWKVFRGCRNITLGRNGLMKCFYLYLSFG